MPPGIGRPGTVLGMLVPPAPLEPPEELELEPLWPDELEVEPLWPDWPDEEDELGLWEEGELGLWDDGELLGELLGEGMLGDGMLGELGGGELLLDEQPASANAAPSSRAGMPRLNVLIERMPGRVAKVMRSAPSLLPAGCPAIVQV